MADRSDYTKSRTNIIDLQSDSFNSEVNKSLIENTFNRFLTKSETVEVIGTIGEFDPAARANRQIQEDTVHRQGYQLQPLIHHKIATVDYATASSDLLNELERLGVDSDRLPKWGDTERFNFAPPVDLDKLVNYTDYYWYDAIDVYVKPQYVVMKTKCAPFSSRLAQKAREIAGVGDSIDIFNVSVLNNEILLLNNVASGFSPGTIFDIVGSLGIDGIYEVEAVEYRDGFTHITPIPALETSSYGGGRITFDTIIRQLTQNKNAMCDGTSGWDASPWDDSENVQNDEGVKLDDPMLLTYIRDESVDVFNAIIDKHPEYLDGAGDIVATQAWPLWKWLEQPKPEFTHKWDWTGSSVYLSDWQVENKWIHKLDLPPGAIAKSVRAVAPIIEYLGNLEVNEWSYTAHSWLHRVDPIRDTFAPSTVEPSDDDYLDPEFLDKWIYVGAGNPLPINHQLENSMANLMSVDSTNINYKLKPYVGAKILSVLSSTSFKVSDEYIIEIGNSIIIHTLLGTQTKTVTNVVLNNDDTKTIFVLGAVSGLVTTGDAILLPAGTGPFNVVMFDQNRWNIALAGQQNTRVYIDGREQIGNYAELLYQTGQGVYSNGVFMDTFVSQQSLFEVGIDPSAEVDKNRGLWNVRTTEWMNDQDYRDFGRPTRIISPIRYRYHQQHKNRGETKFPLFDIYYPNGETAFRANEIFTYTIDQDADVESNIGLRVKKTNSGRTFHFSQLLLDYDNGPMFCYKDFDELDRTPTGLFTIWRTSADIRYVPRYVNERRRADGDEYYTASGEKVVESVPYGSGDWEIPSQLYFNSSHENRIEINSIELLEHVKTILRNQETLEGFRPNPQYGHRLLTTINYGVGGTIHEHNDSWDLLASAMFSSNNSPLDVLDFASTAYESALNSQEDFILTNAYDALLNTDIQYIGDIGSSMVKAAIEQYEFNDNNNLLFGDTSAYINGKGVQSWPATAPILGLVDVQAPNHLIDEKLGVSEIKHHDGHYSWNRITQGDLVAIAKRVVRHKYKETGSNVDRFRGWTPTQAAVGTEKYASFDLIPTSKLMPIDYWLEGSTFKRFEVVAISPVSPSNASPAGSLWLRSDDQQLMVRTATTMNPWVPLVVDGVETLPGDTIHAWKDIDLTAILNNLIMEIERRLSDAAVEHAYDGLKFTEADFITDELDEILYGDLLERSFLEFSVKRQIAYPYASVYIQTDPFSWNFKGVDANERDVTDRMINIWAPYANNSDVDWKGTWQGTYLRVFGTMYPHLEPWVLQGYTNKPTWWESEYADPTGARRWTALMWENVIANRVRGQFDAPTEYTLETDPDSGTTFKVMEKKFNYVPVNTTRPVTTGSGAMLYDLDDLFPLYDARLLEAANIDIVNSSSIGKPMIRRPEATANVNLKSAYAFGDYSPIELEWRKSTQYNYDLLKIAFIMQPMRFMHKTWGNTYLNVGGLNVNAETNKVFAHVDTIFHGDVIDGETYTIEGMNQWYVNFVRRSGIDFKVSNFRELWTAWTAKMAYQFGGFISTKSFSANTAAIGLIKEDYNIFSKKAPGYDTKWMDSLNVTIANYGNSRIRNGVRVPVGDGKDWTFTVSLPANSSRVMKYYGTRRYNFTVLDADTGTLEIEGANVPWNTGDQVYVDTSMYLPFPMDQVYSYYVIKDDVRPNRFQLSRTAGGAHRGEFTRLRTTGEGIQYIGEVYSTFYAYAGERTDAEWKHHVVDKSQVLELATPFVVQGIQGLVDLIDGYAAYKKDEGFVFNDSSSKETDYNTARLLSWQTEIERAIHTIYSGLGRNNTAVRQYGTTYEITINDVNEDPDTFVMVDGVSPFQYGDRVFMYTTGSMPVGINMNTPYYVIPHATDLTRFQLATTAQNAFDEIAINVTTVGIGRLMVGSFAAPSTVVDDHVEINPFRYNLWIDTPNGILSDVFTGGESYNASEVLIYDQYGRPLPKGSVMVFRNDKVAHVKVRSNMLNDVLIDNSEPTPYNLIHLGGIKVYVDGYEHVVIFNDYMTNGQLVYDGYIGMSLPRFDVVFERAQNRNLRPNIGGYFLHNNDMIRNLEGQVGDMRDFYSTYGASENAAHVPYARALLGYEEPTYLDQLNTPQKSKFAFWKGMIQRKGSQNAVRSFINSEHFVDAKVDEFWAYKIADFGDARPRFKPKVRVLVEDSYNNDLRLEFTDVKHSGTDERFTQITLDDQTRWVDLPSIRKQLNGLNMAFDAKAITSVIDVTTLPIVTTEDGPARKLELDTKLWGQTFQYLDDTTWVNIAPFTSGAPTGYKRPNDRVVLLYGIGDVTELYVLGYVPDVEKLDPIELVDQSSRTTVLRTKYWNPIDGNHYHIPMKNVDFFNTEDPALYETVDWTDAKVGWTWLDSTTLGYVPYNDEIVFPEFNDRIERWGRLAEWATPKLYQWVRSSVDPIVYAETESGQPLKCWYKKNIDFEFEEVNLRPIHSLYNHSAAFDELMMEDQRLELKVFVNGALTENTLNFTILGDVVGNPMDPAEQYNLKDSDYVTFVLTPPEDLIEDETYREDYKFVAINEEDTPVYYFWVADSTNKGVRHGASVNDTLGQLLKPQVPYHVFLKFFTTEPYTQTIGSDGVGNPIQQTIQLPARFTEILIKDIATNINVDDRYVVQFTRFFNLRDDLDSGKSPLDLKNKHAEWYMFRREQSNKIPTVLWTKATESLIGYKLTDFENDVLTPVPSLERVIYDNRFDTTTRYGLEEGQTFVDRDTGIASIQRLIESSNFDTAPVDKYVFLDQHSFDTPLNIKNAMSYIFVNFSSEAVNTIFFELMLDALANKRDYPGLLKTSFIALHGIKILETSGNVTE